MTSPSRNYHDDVEPGTGASRSLSSRLLGGLTALLLLTTGIVLVDFSEPEPAEAAVEDLLECAPTSPYVYNLRSPDNPVNGGRVNQVERINTTDGSREVIVDFTGDILEQINARGIGRDAQGRGRYLYFTTHNIGGTGPGGASPCRATGVLCTNMTC
ncbi:hypothetical protein [Nesterenkonia sp.]|uniref:hypothetical protein n=1 Tax=Nesterenkonia sp. TaxID=704201 RepID=UPI0026380E56|nr:hypothetical protein [Nesterenkonia sp.]